MEKATMTECFARYGASLRNVQWAVSDINDGRLVISLWQHLFQKAEKGVLPYEDRLSRWSGPGNTLCREHIERAYREDLPVCPVIARAEDPEAINSGIDASSVKKTFAARQDLIGRVVSFDGDRFRIEFSKA